MQCRYAANNYSRFESNYFDEMIQRQDFFPGNQSYGTITNVH